MNPEEEVGRSMPPAGDMSDSSKGRAEASQDVDASAGVRPGTTDVQAYIGRQLRAVYEDVVKQPIPDRFLALMKQLEEGAHEP